MAASAAHSTHPQVLEETAILAVEACQSFPARSSDNLTGLLDRGYPPREQLPLPTRPPYTAHLGNLSFDVTSADVEKFFGDCAVTNVRIVEDKLDRKPKGFGYVEYATLDGLKKALELNGTQFQGRNVRISIAEPRKQIHVPS